MKIFAIILANLLKFIFNLTENRNSGFITNTWHHLQSSARHISKMKFYKCSLMKEKRMLQTVIQFFLHLI